MKTKVNIALLVSFFVIFLISVLLIFAIMQNNKLSGWAIILPVIVLFTGALLFAIAMQLMIQPKKNVSENQLTDISTKETDEVNTENAINKTQEIELDPKKIIPKEKLKPEVFSEELLRNLANEISLVQALLYLKSPNDELFKCTGKFAYYSDSEPASFKAGETLPGQAVKNKTIVTISNIPENYMIIASGLGKGIPGYLTFVPIIAHEEVIALIEFATFTPVSPEIAKSLGQLSDKIGESIYKFFKK